jgi:two-component system cell cycle sensor histidine kinase/response regulator CckA
MERILVVDDEAGITTVINAALTRQHYTVITARNGRDALEKLSLGPVDLVITDMIMPDFDGLHLIPEIHRLLPRVRIIAMSAGGDRFSSDTYLKEAKRLGAAHLLAKPFLINELVALVKKTLTEGQYDPVDI